MSSENKFNSIFVYHQGIMVIRSDPFSGITLVIDGSLRNYILSNLSVLFL